MNVKAHTPDSLKKGSGMSSWKQFLLSLLATTVSIVLTFGTTAIIDRNKKQSEKRQIVMMVMYDMYNSLKSIESADSSFIPLMKIQQQVAQDPSRFEELRFQTAFHKFDVVFTETTEQIFSSSIESINTVGNVLFTENVAAFYQNRQLYKTKICDPLVHKIELNPPGISLKNLLGIDYFNYAISSCGYLTTMRQLYAQCKQMMKVTDEEIEIYRKERARIEEGVADNGEATDAILYEIIELQSSIDSSKAKLKFE